MSGGTDEVRNKLAQLAERYLKRTAGEVATLREQLERARSGQAEGYAELRNLAHRMNGTGSTLGFADIGDQAAKIESLAEARSTDFDTMTAGIASIEQLIREAATRSGVTL